MKTRYPLDGPEPPPTVTRIAIGPGGGHWIPTPWPKGVIWISGLYQWRRRSCRRCDEYHYHWTNGDRSRPWWMLANRAAWPYAVDLDALRRVHHKPSKRRGK